MTAVTYKTLALEWTPQQGSEKRFLQLLAGAIGMALFLGVALSQIDLPPKERHERAEVPDRVARFVTQRKPTKQEQKPKPEIAPPPPPPPPLVEQPPRVERSRPEDVAKPLTDAQKQAREVAEQSGLLALREEMSGLMTSGAQARGAMSGEISDSTGAEVIAGHNANVISAGTASGSGGVDGSKYQIASGSAELRDHKITQALADYREQEPALSDHSKGAERSERPPGGRSKESVTMVLDQHKGLLYSLYERERRRSLGLQGVVVVELTIAPSGQVTDARILSSELNSPSLEQRIIARIKTLTFAAMESPPLTVTLPIEFLPS